jgi:hypothetical protein
MVSRLGIVQFDPVNEQKGLVKSTTANVKIGLCGACSPSFDVYPGNLLQQVNHMGDPTLSDLIGCYDLNGFGILTQGYLQSVGRKNDFLKLLSW